MHRSERLSNLKTFPGVNRLTAGIVLYGASLLAIFPLPTSAAQSVPPDRLESAWQFLTRDRDQGGILYTATAGKLAGRQLPLSFYDTPAYWGEHVCRDSDCTVVDEYNPQTYTLLPRPSPAGELQTERVNTHNGVNIYDAATWQIALMLGQSRSHLPLPHHQDTYDLISNQNLLLQYGHFGDSPYPSERQNRALTSGPVFVYNQHQVNDPRRAYSFRMLPLQWLAADPFTGTSYARFLRGAGLPAGPTDYTLGRLSWTDWKPITGENAWAFFIGPLQAAAIHFHIDEQGRYVPLNDPAIDNALHILPTFAAMQSKEGGVYYAPAGTIANQGTTPVDPNFVSVENNISLYAGLRILKGVLQTTLANQAGLSAEQRIRINRGLHTCTTMLNGGMIEGRSTRGIVAFLRQNAWNDGEFVQGGWADKPGLANSWQPFIGLKAVDVNTWGVAAIGTATIDAWHGFGAAFRLWQNVKAWGGYGQGTTLWGVGFSNQDGNGRDAQGNYHATILSAEWSFGALTMVRDMRKHYQSAHVQSEQKKRAQEICRILQEDEDSMLAAMDRLQLRAYAQAGFPGKPHNFDKLFPLPTDPTLYASSRFFIPFGWYANPLPSTCATAWRVMVLYGFNPFHPLTDL